MVTCHDAAWCLSRTGYAKGVVAYVVVHTLYGCLMMMVCVGTL